MSLINDALKRASESDRKRPRQAKAHTPMEPAAARPSGGSLSPVLGIGVVLALALAGWFFFQWWHARHSVAPVKMETAAAAPSVSRQAVPPPAAAPAPVPTPAAAPVVVVPKLEPMPAPESAPPPAKAGPPPWPIELKLMGIFYSKATPQALINARTVSVGDEIQGIRVTRIERDHVTVEWEGQMKQLTLE